MRRWMNNGSSTNSIAMNASHTASIACIHQKAASVNRLHSSPRQTIQKPLAPASSTHSFACGAKPPSVRAKWERRSAGGSRRSEGIVTMRDEGQPADPQHHRHDMQAVGNGIVEHQPAPGSGGSR